MLEGTAGRVNGPALTHNKGSRCFTNHVTEGEYEEKQREGIRRGSTQRQFEDDIRGVSRV